MKAKDLLVFAVKKADPDRAALEESAKMAKKQRRNVWDGLPEPKRGFKQVLLALMPG